MEKQLIFKEKYIRKLEKNLLSGETLDFYRSIEFVYDKNQVLILPNIKKNQDLINKLDEFDDFKSAIYLYESFEQLEPIQASDERLWVYLTHADLYPYMIKRWNNVYLKKSTDPIKYISDHWFLKTSSQSNLIRHPLAGLWWLVYLSKDDTRGINKYELTEILFRQLDFSTRTLGISRLARHKEAVIGILEFIQENDKLFKNKFEIKSRFVTEHLNKIGGVKPITYLDRNFFKSELEKVYSNIASL